MDATHGSLNPRFLLTIIGPPRTEGSASIIVGSLGISGRVVVVPVEGDNSISEQRWIVVAHSIMCKGLLVGSVPAGFRRAF
jgi:hypothetical protein